MFHIHERNAWNQINIAVFVAIFCSHYRLNKYEADNVGLDWNKQTSTPTWAYKLHKPTEDAKVFSVRTLYIAVQTVLIRVKGPGLQSSIKLISTLKHFALS